MADISASDIFDAFINSSDTPLIASPNLGPKLEDLVPLEMESVTATAQRVTKSRSKSSPTSQSSETDSTKKDDASDKRRNRATAEQLSVLEAQFIENPMPSAARREEVAKQIDMSERSVQIWFQNRRAKVKNGRKRGSAAHVHATVVASVASSTPVTEENEVTPSTPASAPVPVMPNTSMINPMSAQAPFKLPITPNLSRTNTIPLLWPLPLQSGFPIGQDRDFICDTLNIGTWTRVALANNDLVCKYNLEQKRISWHIMDGGHHFKIEFFFSDIAKVDFQLFSSSVGLVTFTLTQPPQFYIETPLLDGAKIWTRCQDITEGAQATRLFRHTIKGASEALRQQLTSIVQSDLNLQKVSTIDRAALPTSRRQSIAVGASSSNRPVYVRHPSMSNILTSANFLLPARSYNESDPMSASSTASRKRSLAEYVDDDLSFGSRRSSVESASSPTSTQFPNGQSSRKTSRLFPGPRGASDADMGNNALVEAMSNLARLTGEMNSIIPPNDENVSSFLESFMKSTDDESTETAVTSEDSTFDFLQFETAPTEGNNLGSSETKHLDESSLLDMLTSDSNEIDHLFPAIALQGNTVSKSFL